MSTHATWPPTHAMTPICRGAGSTLLAIAIRLTASLTVRSAYDRLGAWAPWRSRTRSTPAQTAPWSEAKLRSLRIERATVTVLAARTLGARLTAAFPVASSDTARHRPDSTHETGTSITVVAGTRI